MKADIRLVITATGILIIKVTINPIKHRTSMVKKIISRIHQIDLPVTLTIGLSAFACIEVFLLK